MNRLATLALALAACSSERAPAAAPAPGLPITNNYQQSHVLRTYKVPVEHEKAIERLLRDITYPLQVVSQQGTQTQFVALSPQLTGSGVIVLSAPVGIHEGVAQMIDQLKGAKTTSPATIDTTCWVVLGWPAKERAIAPELKDAAPALEALGELGPMRFELLDRVQLAAIDGEHATSASTVIPELKEVATLDGDRISLRLEIQVGGGAQRTQIQTTVTVKPNQFAVLGQAGYTPDKPSLAAQTAGQTGRATLFYLVRARTLP